MPFKNEWSNTPIYYKGDVVYLSFKNYSDDDDDDDYFTKYYTCTVDHQSCDVINPDNKEEIYWCEIEEEFLTYYLNLNSVELPFTYRSSSEPLPISEKDIIQIIMNTSTKKNKEVEIIEVPIVIVLSEEELKIQNDKKIIKRKIEVIETELQNHKKIKKNNLELTLGEQLRLLEIDNDTKIFLIDKYEMIKKNTGSEHIKGIAWVNTVLSLPFNKYKDFNIKYDDSKIKINNFFSNIKNKLDEKIHGLDYVKDEIMEYLAKKITNPKSNGHVLALYGNPGVGKSAIISALGDALNLPFHQINMGGLNDVSILTGHSETYISAKPGKIVEILSNSGYMNSIIFLDEIDKFSENKSKELNGILTHILDEDQNHKFQDNYLSNINIDLSKVFFVVAFNDITKVNSIILNRMKIIEIKNPSIEDKLIIARDKILPKLTNGLLENLKIKDEILLYIIKEKISDENGVRQMKKSLEKIINRLNFMLLTGKIIDINTELTYEFIDKILTKNTIEDNNYKMMYI